MTQCFRDHPSDTQILNENTKPLDECETRIMELYGVEMEVTQVPILTCDCLWRIYQREAEEIVAPGGVLIADPIERNRAINAAYARLWLHDSRFQWAGLAAFASKQVGCGLLHAANVTELIEAEHEARQPLRDNRREWGLFTKHNMDDQTILVQKYKATDDLNPMPADWRCNSDEPSVAQNQFQYVNEMMALGNTTLFLDIFPLHAFYKKRGLAELKKCLKNRAAIYGHPKFPVLWLVDQKKLIFGEEYEEIFKAFIAIESGKIAKSVEYFAIHEQKNILQPTIYEDSRLRRLLRANHASFVTGLPSGVAQAIELTLTSQCQRTDDGKTVEFSNNPLADLSNLDERMKFVLRAAKGFNTMLHDHNRSALEQSIKEIAQAGAVQ